MCRDIAVCVLHRVVSRPASPGRVSDASQVTSRKLSLVLLEKVCEKSNMRAMLRGLLLWKRNVDKAAREAERVAGLKRRNELEAEYSTGKQLLLEQREQEQVLLRDEHTSVLREREERREQEVAQYKGALLRQRQRLLEVTNTWSKQQAEHSALSARTDEMLRLEHERAAETNLANSSTVANLENAVAAEQMAVQTAESKLRDMEGMCRVYVYVCVFCRSWAVL